MSNIFHNNFHNLKLRVNTDEYWDLALDKCMYNGYDFTDKGLYDKCLISYIDTELKECIEPNGLKGAEGYVWENSQSIGYSLNNIGYTGFDNGLLNFRKDRIMNSDFLKLYKDSTYDVEPNNTLKLHIVSGSTQVFEYPSSYEDEKAKLNGGFYQGFFKTECDKYQVLPTQNEQGDVWVYDFVLKREDFEKESNKTLNDKYPNNKGIFFYLGTRSENKWIYLYDKDENDECFALSYDDYIDGGELDVDTHIINNFLDMSFDMEECDNTLVEDEFLDVDFGGLDSIPTDYLEDDIDISNISYTTDGELIIGDYEEYMETDNKFLLFDRTENGFKVNDWEEGTVVRTIKKRNSFNENLFLLMNRTETGYTVDTIKELVSQYDEKYNLYKDLYNNALAFRITDNGEIGYRYLVEDCEGGADYSIKEAYSKPNIVPYGKWSNIVVKIYFQVNTMVLKFYVDGNLVFISDPMPKLNLRALDDTYEKQETVPFNISIGGGTQGLCDVILPNYMIEPYRVYPLEEHFAGTFIGYFKTFKFYTCDVESQQIRNNFKKEIAHLN